MYAHSHGRHYKGFLLDHFRKCVRLIFELFCCDFPITNALFQGVLFKPVATIMQSQQTINNKGETVEMQGKGRHDPCVVPRAVPIVEAMAALVLADLTLLNRAVKK